MIVVRKMLLAVACACLTFSGAANASPVLYWSVSGAFDDSTTFSGIFATTEYGFVNTTPSSIATNDGAISGFVYPQSGSPANTIDPSKLIVELNRPGYRGFLEIAFAYDLTQSGNFINPIVVGSLSYECDGFQFGSDSPLCTGTERHIVSGFATVPEPTTTSILGVVLSWLAARRRRGRSRACSRCRRRIAVVARAASRSIN